LELISISQKYLKSNFERDSSVCEAAIDAIKNFLEGPMQRNQDILSKSLVLN
jgi:hypothetical protein